MRYAGFWTHTFQTSSSRVNPSPSLATSSSLASAQTRASSCCKRANTVGTNHRLTSTCATTGCSTYGISLCRVSCNLTYLPSLFSSFIVKVPLGDNNNAKNGKASDESVRKNCQKYGGLHHIRKANRDYIAIKSYP